MLKLIFSSLKSIFSISTKKDGSASVGNIKNSNQVTINQSVLNTLKEGSSDE